MFFLPLGTCSLRVSKPRFTCLTLFLSLAFRLDTDAGLASGRPSLLKSVLRFTLSVPDGCSRGLPIFLSWRKVCICSATVAVFTKMYGVMVITLLAGSWKALTGILIVETEVDEEFVDDSDVDEGGFVDDASNGGSLAAAMAIAAGICDN